jgi:hypothetical protein
MFSECKSLSDISLSDMVTGKISPCPESLLTSTFIS